jgi:hypothetical protein
MWFTRRKSKSPGAGFRKTKGLAFHGEAFLLIEPENPSSTLGILFQTMTQIRKPFGKKNFAHFRAPAFDAPAPLAPTVGRTVFLASPIHHGPLFIHFAHPAPHRKFTLSTREIVIPTDAFNVRRSHEKRSEIPHIRLHG